MSHPTRYREVEVSGAPREMGRQIGEAAREEMRGFTAIALDRVNKTVRVSREKAMGIAQDTFTFVEGYAPHMLEELRGMAEGSGVPVEELMLLQVRNQLLAAMDSGCTSLAAGPPAAQGAVVGQNWDNDPGLNP